MKAALTVVFVSTALAMTGAFATNPMLQRDQEATVDPSELAREVAGSTEWGHHGGWGHHGWGHHHRHYEAVPEYDEVAV